MKIKVEGIVIQVNPYKEKDAMVSIITENGIVSFLARNILSITSKNRSSCLLFSYSSFVLNSRLDKLSLVQGTLIKSYYHFYESLDCLSSINLINECLIKFVDEDDSNLYPYLKRYLELLDQIYDEVTLTLIMLAKIIAFSGYSLKYNECVVCSKKTNIVGVSFSLGGFVCKNCLKKSIDKRNKDYLKTYRYVFMVDCENMNHYILDKEIALTLIEEFSNYLASSFGFQKIVSLSLYLNSKG